MLAALEPAVLLAGEARALLARLRWIRSLSLHETMVPAAALSAAAHSGIERLLAGGRRAVADDIRAFLRWIEGPAGRRTAPSEMQRRFTLLRLRLNAVLAQQNLFAAALTQRSEHGNGIWLAGLDAVARDALALPAHPYDPPPVVCYLDQGLGAAIRRARTRLPGGKQSPVALIRVPRERMIGAGLAASIAHEVGHQGAALLGLVPSLREALRRERALAPASRLWDRWISEIVADAWSVATLGVAATLGLMSVVSLPRGFVFRASEDDPHPVPWLRVRLSCVLGRALFPHPQWARLARLWEALYPLDGLPERRRRRFAAVEATMPDFAAFIADHRPPSLRGRSLREALPVAARQPAALRAHFDAWRGTPARLRRGPPTLVLAVLGQARADGRLDAGDEGALLDRLLTAWALRRPLPHPAGPAPPGAATAR